MRLLIYQLRPAIVITNAHCDQVSFTISADCAGLGLGLKV